MFVITSAVLASETIKHFEYERLCSGLRSRPRHRMLFFIFLRSSKVRFITTCTPGVLVSNNQEKWIPCAQKPHSLYLQDSWDTLISEILHHGVQSGPRRHVTAVVFTNPLKLSMKMNAFSVSLLMSAVFG